MKITDKEVLELIKKVRSLELEEAIDLYPDDERDGRSDMEFLTDEVSYIVSLYFEHDHAFRDDLEECRRKLTETKYGKVIPLNPSTLKPQSGYWPSDIQSAKDCVNEFNRLCRLLVKLQRNGYYGKWYML